jgi:hypothetical protein
MRQSMALGWVSSVPTRAQGQGHSQAVALSASTPLQSSFIGGTPAPFFRAHSRCLQVLHQTQQRHVTAIMASVGAVDKVVERSVVWFRVGDLRLRDHEGLTRASVSSRKSIIPLFIVTPSTPASVFPTLETMRKGLRSRNADLVLRFAESEAQGVAAFCSEQPGGVDAIHVRGDADELGRQAVRDVETELGAGICRIWQQRLRAICPTADMPDVYPKFKRWAPRAKLAVPASAVQYECATLVPGLPAGESAPTPGDVDDIRLRYNALTVPESVAFILDKFEVDSARVGVVHQPDSENGEALVVNVLDRMEQYEEFDLGRQLQPVIWLGLVSPRRIWEIVVDYERTRGRLWRPFYRFGAKTILSWLDAREFADLLAERDLAQRVTTDGMHVAKFWRWRVGLS